MAHEEFFRRKLSCLEYEERPGHQALKRSSIRRLLFLRAVRENPQKLFLAYDLSKVDWMEDLNKEIDAAINKAEADCRAEGIDTDGEINGLLEVLRKKIASTLNPQEFRQLIPSADFLNEFRPIWCVIDSLVQKNTKRGSRTIEKPQTVQECIAYLRENPAVKLERKFLKEVEKGEFLRTFSERTCLYPEWLIAHPDIVNQLDELTIKIRRSFLAESYIETLERYLELMQVIDQAEIERNKK